MLLITGCSSIDLVLDERCILTTAPADLGLNKCFKEKIRLSWIVIFLPYQLRGTRVGTWFIFTARSTCSPVTTSPGRQTEKRSLLFGVLPGIHGPNRSGR